MLCNENLNLNENNFQKSTSIKKTIDCWHIQSSNWLRRITYERLPAGKTMGYFIFRIKNNFNYKN